MKSKRGMISRGRERWLLLLIAGLTATLTTITVAKLAAAASPTCGESLQAMVNAATPGATVEAPGDCVYRQTVTINKPLTLRGGPDAEIRGSDVWTNWTKSGSYWVKGTLPSFPAHGYCQGGSSRCLWPEQVFFDGRPLVQVASDPKSGQFAVDAERRVILTNDPTGHLVEVSVRRYWVLGKSDGVTIEGFTMKHAANDAQTGAIMNRSTPGETGYPDWTVRNNVLSDAHGAVVSLAEGAGLELVGNDVSRGGQEGVHIRAGDILLQANKIHHNHTEGFAVIWEAGGVKAAAVRSLTADGNEVYANDGNGMWCDRGCTNVVYSNNRVHHNQRKGINFEISSGAKIHDNIAWENGWGVKERSSKFSGISVLSSNNVEVYNNILAWNNAGISVIADDRAGTTSDPVTGIDVHHNTFLGVDYPREAYHHALAWIKLNSTSNIYDPASNNQGHDNSYWYATPESPQVRYKWDTNLSKLGAFNETLGEERGRYLTETEKDLVIATSGIPASPERVPPPPDTTSPTITLTTPPDGATYTLGQSVNASYSCTDEVGGWGLNSCVGSVADGAAIDTGSPGPKTFTVNAEDNAGNTNSITHVYEVVPSLPDTTAPTTTATPSPEPNGTGWNNADVAVSLSAKDEQGGSGVAGITYSATGAQQIASNTVPGNSARINVIAEGQTTITYFATDNAGNAETARSFTVKLDKTKPTINCGTADGLWHKDDVSIACTASDDGSSLTDPAVASFSLSTSVPGGMQTANASTNSRQVCDAAGNCVTAGPIAGIMIDKKAPETMIETGPAGFVNSGSATFGFSSSETGATFECSLDGAAYSGCASPENYANLADEEHTFRVKATDVVGNTDGSPAGRTWTVDTAAPSVSVLTPAENANDVATSVNITATFTEGMDASTIGPGTFKLIEQGGVDTVPVAVGYDVTTRSATLDPSSDLEGGKTYAATITTGVKDLAGNALADTRSWSFTTARPTDVTPPAAPSVDLAAASDTGTSSTDDVTSDTTTTLAGKAEAGSRIEVFDDAVSLGTATADGSGDWSLTTGTLGEGAHQITADATDAAGNASAASAVLKVTIDTTAPAAEAPTESFTTGSQLGTSTIPVKLAWSAADGGSGVAKYELQQSANGGPYAGVGLPSATATSIVRWLAPGSVYNFRLRAQDRAGNRSTWKAGRSFQVDAHQESSSAVTYGGTWLKQSPSSAYGGALRYASGAGNKATFAFNGSEVAWVASRAGDRGKADVYVDGVKVQTVDLYATSMQARKVMLVKSWPSSGSHTLEVRVLGTKNSASGGTRVDVDAFVVLR